MKKHRAILMYDFLHEVGGLEKLMAIHAGYLKKQGYDVEILFSYVNKKILKENPIYRNFNVREYGYLGKGTGKIISGVMGFNKLKQIIKPEDIIISYSFPVNYTIRNFKNTKIQYLNHFPNFLYLPMKEKILWANNISRKVALFSSLIIGSMLRRIDKGLIRNNKLIFMNSQFTKNRLDNLYGIKGIVSYPPVSADIKPTKDKKILLKYGANNKKVVFASGRVIPDKRIDLLIEAFSKINDNNTILLISGQIENKQRKILENLAKKLGVINRIRFLGIIPKNDLIALYSMADIYVFPAPKEDFGLVPAEAISCGTPVVVWGDDSGPNEIIRNNINGLYAKPYNTTDFAKNIEIGLNKKWDKEKILQSSKRFSEKRIRKDFIKAVKKVISFANQE
jgi:glycosyltransferase involved in cell wall biosynthesis